MISVACQYGFKFDHLLPFIVRLLTSRRQVLYALSHASQTHKEEAFILNAKTMRADGLPGFANL